jgi:hypothetical protein
MTAHDGLVTLGNEVWSAGAALPDIPQPVTSICTEPTLKQS